MIDHCVDPGGEGDNVGSVRTYTPVVGRWPLSSGLSFLLILCSISLTLPHFNTHYLFGPAVENSDPHDWLMVAASSSDYQHPSRLIGCHLSTVPRRSTWSGSPLMIRVM